jgi:hypothetical protein
MGTPSKRAVACGILGGRCRRKTWGACGLPWRLTTGMAPEAIIPLLAPDVEWIADRSDMGRVTYRGPDGVRKSFEQLYDAVNLCVRYALSRRGAPRSRAIHWALMGTGPGEPDPGASWRTRD